jgi:hypothetical protein
MKPSIKTWILTAVIPFCLGAFEPNTELPELSLPIQCTIALDCVIQNYPDRDSGPDAKDYTCGSQTYQSHTGTDFRLKDLLAQRHGVAVLAAAPGRILRVRDGIRDVSIRVGGAAAVAGRECGNALSLIMGQGSQHSIAIWLLTVSLYVPVILSNAVKPLDRWGFQARPSIPTSILQYGSIML